MIDIFYFYPTIFFASFISTIGGYGTGALVMATGMMFFDAREILGITTLVFLTNNITKLALFGKHIDLKISKTFIIWSVPAAVLGASLTIYIPSSGIQLGLGAMIVFYLVAKYLKLGSKLKVTQPVIRIASILYGLITSLTGTGGIIKAAVFIEVGLVKEAFIATFALTSMFVNITKLIIYSNYHYINSSNLEVALTAIVFCISGIFLGKYVLKKFISEKLFEYLVTALLGISAVKLLFF